MKNNYFLVGGVLLIGLLAAVLIWGLPAAAVKPANMPVVGKPLQTFELTTLKGQNLQLNDLRGKVVVLNFWATWCDPCRAEMPLLQKIQDQYSDKLVVVGVNIGESQAAVQKFADSYHLSFPIVLDPKQTSVDLYYIGAFPTTFFLDKDGILQAQQVGGMDEGTLDRYLQNLGVIE
jgi:thiol-disulfide isomerase/thioredoxin